MNHNVVDRGADTCGKRPSKRIGKVFEELLEVQDRKSKGAFYTPREIVHYMCQETLINHLVTKTGISEEAIRDFILYGEYLRDEDTVKTLKVTDESGKTHYEFDKNKDLLISEEILCYKTGVNRLKELDDLLANVKVADLAVGSGAFSFHSSSFICSDFFS